MRTLVILIYLPFVFSCSNKDNSEGSEIDTLQVSQFDTLQTSKTVLNNNVQYIGFIDKFYFSSENEAYIELYFRKDEINAEEYNKIVKLADSLIYQDDENSRYKFPASFSQKYFDLSGLSKLKIFDKYNNFFCNAVFMRVEYLNQNISSPFIAVYKTEKKIEGDNFYGMSNFNETFEKHNYVTSNDTVLTQNILKNLNENMPLFGLEINGTHLHFTNSDTIVSIINSENYAYIVLTTKNDFKVLYKSPEFENIIDLIVTPLTSNKLPDVLTRNAKPESDVMWDKLLVYDGTNYKTMNRQRIEK